MPSESVHVGNLNLARVDDPHGGCGAHEGPMTKGSRHVFVENKPIVREHDLPQCGGKHDHEQVHDCFVGTGHMSFIKTIQDGPGPVRAPPPGHSARRRRDAPAPHYTPIQQSSLSTQAKAVLAREDLTAWFTGIPSRAAAAAYEMDQGLQGPNQNPNGFHPGLLASGLAHMVIDTARAGVPVVKDFSDPSDPFSTRRVGTKQEDLDNFVDKAILFHPAVATTVAVAGVLRPRDC